jgi:coenzyme F420-reducing hydrogenase delta subunit
VNWVKTLLAKVGVEHEQLHRYNLSASMGPRAADIVKDMVERIRKLGPSPVRGAPRRPADAAGKSEGAK